MKIAKRKPTKLEQAVRLLAVCGVLIVCVGVYLVVTGDNATGPVVQQVADAPKEKEVSSQFQELSEVPTRIMIDAIGVDAEIIPVGLTADGLMDDPDSNHQVGWYTQSARAGQDKYAMLLDGHYGTDTVPAVFRELTQVKLGDTIRIQGDDGTMLVYQVVETDRQYTEDVDMKKALYPYREGVQSLTIITCEGVYDPVNITYDKRTIVYAERVE